MNYIKKITAYILCFVLAAIIGWTFFFSNIPDRIFADEKDSSMFRTKDRSIQLCKDGSWEDYEIKGINMGTGYPGLFPNDTGISEDTYYRWFEKISEANVNTVRVYKIQAPEFYTALYKFNDRSKKKLYLIQGVDFSDELMYSEKNVFDVNVQKKIFKDTYDVIDAIHGKNVMLNLGAGEMYLYTKDVSEYVIGYILGVEWDEMFVDYTCKMNEGVSAYKGDYAASSENANPLEVFMAKWGDRTLEYEEKKWGCQKLLSYCNWPLTDALYNEFETQESDMKLSMPDVEATFDIDNIKAGKKMKTGIFVSYNVYPYYPYFLQCGAYTEYEDETGTRNPYRKYLMEVVDHHKYPVVISEYGVASSRSVAYTDIWRGTNHGGLNEKEQGEALKLLHSDIKKAGCAGNILFTWQDEWYKNAWNERHLSDPDRRAFWGNVQCAEQQFGLLAFDGDEKGECVYPDGDLSDWEDKNYVTEANGLKLKMHSDEKYMYFLVENIDFNGKKDGIDIYLDVTPNSGSEKFEDARFDRGVDFVIKIGKDKKASLLVQDYYDSLIFSTFGRYPELNNAIIEKINRNIGKESCSQDTERFSLVTRAGDTIESAFGNSEQVVPVGKLLHGSCNPKSSDFDSNADFFCSKDAVEIRIPWQLLNFYDPSQRMVLDDFVENGYKAQGFKIRSVYAACAYAKDKEVSEFGSYSLKKWNKPKFHERIKESYYAVQDMFEEENGDDSK